MEENKPLYIVDASVILKWFIENDERDKEKSLQLQHDFFPDEHIRLGIPEHALVETMNILGRKMNFEIASSRFQDILNFNMEEYRLTLEIVFHGLRIMEKFSGVSFYDAAYHALALLENGIFITADEQYFRKTHRQGNIMLLKNYGKKR